MKTVRRHASGALALLVCAASSQAGPFVFVDDSAPAGGDGASWETAFNTLQAALDAARVPASGVVEIRVGQGLYRPDQGPGRTAGDRTQSFALVQGVAVRGGYEGFGAGDPNNRQPKTFITTLSGDLLANDAPGFMGYEDNSHSVVSATSIGGPGAVLDGFRVRAGNAGGQFPNSEGGGLDIRTSTVNLISCVFADNQGVFGAGVYAKTSTLLVSSCEFINNFAFFFGGGLLADGGSCTLRFSTFRGNESLSSGGGLNTINATVSAHACAFIDNESFNGAGALVFGSAAHFVSCRFLGNLADGSGGGVANQGGAASWTNCLFSGNFAAANGGAIDAINAAIRNSTFWLNVAGGLGGGVHGTNPTIGNSVLWANSDSRGAGASSQIEEEGTLATVNYSIVQGNGDRPSYVGTNNLGSDPQFLDPFGEDSVPGTDDDDLRVAQSSPAIDSGSNALLPQDVTDADGDLDVSEQLPFDIAGEQRRIDVPSVADTGSGAAPIVDRGAYERVGTPVPPCPADVNGDGFVNSVDLAQLLGQWGPGAGAADINGDGFVNSVDLAQLLGQWGACPAG